MKRSSKFKRRALLLFLIVSVMPALTVSTLWYFLTKDTVNASFITIGNFVAPVALIGLLPAFILGILFAELLALPVRKLHQGIIQIALGNFDYRIRFSRISEFYEMAEALNAISANLQTTLTQKDSENEIIASERNKLKTLLDNMTDGVFALDSGNRIMLFNRAAQDITGHTLENVAGRIWTEVLLFEDEQQHHPIIEWLDDTKRPAAKRWVDLRLACTDQVRHVNVQVVRVDDDPSGIHVLGTFHDITEKEQLEEMELNFVAMAAHELRTPLTTIKGYLDILAVELDKKLTDEHRDFVNRSVKGLDHLTALVNNLLNVSRIEQGELSFQLEPVDWAHFLRELEPTLRERADISKRKLILKVPRTTAKVAVDQLAIAEVLNNLVENATKHTKEGDTITISCRSAHDGIETTVSDHGTGIPKEAQAQLFTKFFRVEGLHRPGGTGLGLYICKSIVEAHLGYIWVESQVGKGSTFGFNLPLHKAVKGKAAKSNKGIIRGAHGWIKAHTTSRRRTTHK
jgi:PAS domain S-box-containing protein